MWLDQLSLTEKWGAYGEWCDATVRSGEPVTTTFAEWETMERDIAQSTTEGDTNG